MFDPQKAKAENDRINVLLMKEPEYELIQKDIEHIKATEAAIIDYKNQIAVRNKLIQEIEAGINESKERIKANLIALESSTGFSKAPGLAHLMTVPIKYEIKDPNAVPAEFIKTKMTCSIDKVKLNKAIAIGQLDTNVNWLEKIESYKTVVIE